MKIQNLTFQFVEKKLRKKTFGVLTTQNEDGSPHTTGILFAVSEPDSRFELYAVTGKSYRKTKNIERFPSVSFLIPFPHHVFRFVPSSTVTITGTAEILSFKNEKILKVFSEKRILKMITTNLTEEEKDELILVRIKPDDKILCYGLGINILKLRGSHTSGGYSVKIPENRR